jgi:mycothiol S-conjugate amidase
MSAHARTPADLRRHDRVPPARRCLLTVHAHPDDEASKGAPTVARAVHGGAHAVLVTCTGGELGDLQNPAVTAEGGVLHGLDEAAWRELLPAVRAAELARATEVIGFHEVVLLGYRDSGMPGHPANDDPRSFHRAPIDDATERLVAAIRRTRPQVLITYGDDQRGYPHPDHVRVHDISVLAFERAGDPEWYPDAGRPWQPQKLYYSVWSRARLVAWHEAFIAAQGSSPFDEHWFERPSHDDRITTRVPVAGWHHVRRQALLAHATQVDPAEPFWFGLTDDQLDAAYPWEDWILARSLVGFPDDGVLEADLFERVVDGPAAEALRWSDHLGLPGRAEEVA